MEPAIFEVSTMLDAGIRTCEPLAKDQLDLSDQAAGSKVCGC